MTTTALSLNRLWKITEVADYLGVSVDTMRYWRAIGEGRSAAGSARLPTRPRRPQGPRPATLEFVKAKSNVALLGPPRSREDYDRGRARGRGPPSRVLHLL